MYEADPQQFRLYRLEREEIGARDYARLTLPECKRVARSVCRAYGVPQVRIVSKVMPRWAAMYDPNHAKGLIELNPENGAATDLLTVLHELAHHLHRWLAPNSDEHEDHGPQFMACYMSILDTVRLIPRDAMATICKRRKLKYINPGPSIASLKQALAGEAP